MQMYRAVLHQLPLQVMILHRFPTRCKCHFAGSGCVGSGEGGGGAGQAAQAERGQGPPVPAVGPPAELSPQRCWRCLLSTGCAAYETPTQRRDCLDKCSGFAAASSTAVRNLTSGGRLLCAR